MDLLNEANKLAGHLAHGLKQSLFEDDNKSGKKIIAVYSGRFSPFHAGHMSVYNALVKKFGENNVYIASSNKVELPRSPLSFDQKKLIMTSMFDINPDKIKQVKNPYNPTEILDHYDPQHTAYVTAVSDKDANRLSHSGKYFHRYVDDTPLQGYQNAGYYVVTPALADEDGGPLSASNIRKVLGSDKVPEETKRAAFRKIYGKDNNEIFDLLVQKSTEAEQALHGQSITSTDKTTNTPASEPTKLVSKKKTSDTKEKKNPIDGTITNPDTGRDIKVKSALKYPRWKNVYKAAEKHLKDAGVDRPNRVDNPEVNRRYEKRKKAKTKDEMVSELTSFISENLLGKWSEVISEWFERELLQEAAPQSHIQHPYDDVNMTFGELEGIISQALTGDFDGTATEKIDGQNILFTVRDGEVKFARNTQQTKDGAKNAMNAREFTQFFSNHGENISKVFGSAAYDVESAIKKLPKEEVDKIFHNGTHFATGELVNSELPNTIPYNTKQIILTSVREYDPSTGNPIAIDGDAAQRLANDMSKAGGNRTYKISASNNIQFKHDSELAKKKLKYIHELKILAGEDGFNDKNTLGEWLADRWKNLLMNQNMWTPEEISGMVKRWAYNDKSFGSRHIEDPHKKEEFKALDAQSKDLTERFMQPIKKIVLNVGADAMKRSTNLIAGHDGTDQKLKDRLKQSIDAIKNSGDQKYIDKMKRELQQLNLVGVDNIAPSEGIVFHHKGKLMKLTGAFAPVNQIVGINTYKLNPVSHSDEPVSAVEKEKDGEDISPDIKRKLNQRIVNPETKNSILVKTALGYDKSHPAYKVARKALGEVFVVEGGHQFDKVNSVVPKEELNDLVSHSMNRMGFKLPFSIVGNKNKPYLGDIDVAIDRKDLEHQLGERDPKLFYAKIQKDLNDKGIESRIQPGLNQFSILVPRQDKEGKTLPAISSNGTVSKNQGFVQLDVFIGNRKWMEKTLSGAGVGSKYKGAPRNTVFIAAFSKIILPTSNPKIFEKYQINSKEGLEKVQFTVDADGKRVKLHKELVTSDPDKMISILFKDTKWDDVDTFEKMYAKLQSPDFKFPDKRHEIVDELKRDIQQNQKLPLPTELGSSVEKSANTITSKEKKTDINVHDLNKTIKNPETGHEILVKTALGYDKSHPAYKAAVKVVRPRNGTIADRLPKDRRMPPNRNDHEGPLR